MKNIYIIPTDKPSRLYIGNNGNFVFGMIQTSIQSRNDDFTNQNIYITSDEEIKVGEYCITKTNEVIRFKKSYTQGFLYKKIILTTDQSLIQDDVQAINDEFLEWFVKNPSCERVEVKKEQYHQFVGMKKLPLIPNYIIIIPKVEPKKVLTEEDIFNQKDIDVVTDYINRETSKQETLEEHNYLQGFINQFEEEGEHQELSNDDWTVSRFLQWLQLNNFKIIKDAN